MYLKLYIIEENPPIYDTRELWGDSPKVTHQYIFSLQSYVLRAEDIGLITTRKQTTEFLYWFYKGNTELIADEINDARACKKYQLVDSHKGLKWLVGKINKSRSPNDQLGDII